MPDSGGFLFVCNSGVHTDDSKRLDPKRHYELSTEIDAFYALTQLGDGKSDMTIYAYDKQPRMNMIFVDGYLILQYYSDNVQGTNNPSFFIEKQAESPVYEFCEKSYNYLKSEAKPMEIR